MAHHPASRHPSASGMSRPASAPGAPRVHLSGQFPLEEEHQLEKLQFSLAVALTRGDQSRSEELRAQIAALGGSLEEPGT